VMESLPLAILGQPQPISPEPCTTSQPSRSTTRARSRTEPAGRYRTIIADPPWRYSHGRGVAGGVEHHYPTMSIEELCALPVADLAAPDSCLLLWATWPCLPDAVRLMEAWGFAHVTGFPWVKTDGEPTRTLFGETEIRPRFGIGFWVRGCSEAVLVGRRGTPPLPSGDFLGLLSPNLGHSRKPENLYEYAEAMPGPYLELFARRPRPGWDVWGNEVEPSGDGALLLAPAAAPGA